MKIKIKNFVFAGIAAAMFASIAHAEVSPALQEGDLTSNATTDKYVTAKSYVDRVVLNHKNNTDVHVTAAQKTEWSGKQDAISDLSTIRSGAALGATALQSDAITNMEVTTNKKQTITNSESDYPSGAAVYSHTNNQNIHVSAADREAWNTAATNAADVSSKQDRADSSVTAAQAEAHTLLTEGPGVAANLVSIANQAEINADNITGLQNAKENLSNKVTQGFVSVDGSGNITSVADGNSANYASTGAISSDLKKVKAAIDLKQNTISDLSDIRSGAALGATALQSDDITDMEVTTNKKQTITNSETDYPSGAAVYSHTNNGDIHVTSTQKTNWQNATDAVNDASTGLATKLPTSTYNTQIGTVSSGNMGTTSGTVVGAINELSTAIGTLNTASGNYQLIANKATDVTTVAAAEKDTKYPTVGAVQAPSSCNSSAPCAWVNNAWVPIQQ